MLFDTHCHLDLDVFDADREAVLARALEVQVTRLMNPSFDLVSSRRVVKLADERAGVYAAVGVHPNDLAALDESGLSELRTLASLPKVVAIGEIGLDYHWNTFPPEQQQAGFVAQLELAQALQRPVVIHCRDAYDDMLDILEHHMPKGKVLLHSFAGTGGHAARALAHSYFLGIGGPITYKKATGLREIVHDAPLSQIVLETDAPYLAPHPYRGKRNEPSYLALTAQAVGVARGLSVAVVAEATTSSACGFFGLT